MIIAFLQLRKPPVLPALHQLDDLKRPASNEEVSKFADDVDKLRGFGRENKESIGELLFHFYRFYAHEFDYDKFVLAVRLGKMMPKKEKNWHLTHQNNMLCVEEPFNTARNLGNTADDTSFRGLHLELRRAFDLVAEAKLQECCEQYVFPKEEEKIFQKPASAPRPVLMRSSSQQQGARGGRGGNYRGNRQFSRNNHGANNRRASSSVTYENPGPMYLPNGVQPMTPQDMQWFQQAPYQLHPEMLSNTLNALQIQERSLRFQMYTMSQSYNQQVALAHAQRMQGVTPSQSTDRSRTNSFDNPPLTAPLRPELYMYQMPMQQQPPYFFPQQQGFTTLPSSPSATGSSEFRRSLHRTNGTTDSSSTSSGTLRSQSQPATRTPMPGIPGQPQYSTALGAAGVPAYIPRSAHNGVPIPSFIPDETADSEFETPPAKAVSDTPSEEEGTRYLGYYVNAQASSSKAALTSQLLNGVPAFGDLGKSTSPGRRRLSTDQLPQTILDRRMRRASRSPSPGHSRAFSVGTNTAPLPSVPFAQANVPNKAFKEKRPLVVNGSGFGHPASAASSNRQPSGSESVQSDESSHDNPLRIPQGLGISGLETKNPQPLQKAEITPPPVDRPPLVVNGSTSALTTPPSIPPPDPQSFGQRMAAAQFFSQTPHAAIVSSNMTGYPQLSPSSRQRMMSRQQQNFIAPLDLAMPNHGPGVMVPEPFPHLSPVYETRTPSPNATRKNDWTLAHGFSNQARTNGQPSFATTVKDTRKNLPPKPVTKGALEQQPGSAKPESHVTQPSNPRLNGIVGRENGHIRGAKSESDNAGAWQRPKAKKKGGDAKASANGFLQGEQLPKNEADRKGG